MPRRKPHRIPKGFKNAGRFTTPAKFKRYQQFIQARRDKIAEATLREMQAAAKARAKIKAEKARRSFFFGSGPVPIPEQVFKAVVSCFARSDVKVVSRFAHRPKNWPRDQKFVRSQIRPFDAVRNKWLSYKFWFLDYIPIREMRELLECIAEIFEYAYPRKKGIVKLGYLAESTRSRKRGFFTDEWISCTASERVRDAVEGAYFKLEKDDGSNIYHQTEFHGFLVDVLLHGK